MSDRAAPGCPSHLRYGLPRVTGRECFVVRQVLGPFYGKAIGNSVKEELVELRCRIVGRVARQFRWRHVEMGGESVADGIHAVFFDHRARCTVKNLPVLGRSLYLQECERQAAQSLNLRRFLQAIPRRQRVHWHAERGCESQRARLIRASSEIGAFAMRLFPLIVVGVMLL